MNLMHTEILSFVETVKRFHKFKAEHSAKICLLLSNKHYSITTQQYQMQAIQQLIQGIIYNLASYHPHQLHTTGQ